MTEALYISVPPASSSSLAVSLLCAHSGCAAICILMCEEMIYNQLIYTAKICTKRPLNSDGRTGEREKRVKYVNLGH